MSEMWFYPDLAQYIKRSTEATRQLVSREIKNGGGSVPLPKGRVGRSPYWLQSQVEKFYAKSGGRKQQGGRPRNPPVV